MAKKRDQTDGSGGGQNAPGEGPQPSAADANPQTAGAQQPSETQPSSEPDAPSVAPAVPSPEEQIADLRDKLLRRQADFENFRKRMLREREDAVHYANATLLTDIIGLIDDFERAIKSAEESKDFPNFLQGVTMIEKQFLEVLESRYGLKRFSSVGESFDPNRHEAVQRVEGPAGTRPTVVEDFQKGYFLYDRVLRPARVKVMVPGAEKAPGNDGGEASAGDEVRAEG
ncbi:MAG TPA: nucleotide exchange factor GrpE [Spirochaetia bacterium]|nr:nucleotide exchange factor GrpE [Spirochaetia bacterium]